MNLTYDRSFMLRSKIQALYAHIERYREVERQIGSQDRLRFWIMYHTVFEQDVEL